MRMAWFGSTAFVLSHGLAFTRYPTPWHFFWKIRTCLEAELYVQILVVVVGTNNRRIDTLPTSNIRNRVGSKKARIRMIIT